MLHESGLFQQPLINPTGSPTRAKTSQTYSRSSRITKGGKDNYIAATVCDGVYGQ